MRARPMPAWAGGARRQSRRPWQPPGGLGLWRLALLGLAALVAWYLNGAEAELQPGSRISGVVERIVDGDTLVLSGQRLRLRGLDAPELAQECTRADGSRWACGRESASYLKRILGTEPLACDFHSRDRYRRPLVTCSLKDGTDPGSRLVAAGFAVASGRYAAEEAEARQGKAGMWQGPFEDPSAFRREAQGGSQPGNPSRFERFLDWFSHWLGS